MKLKELKFLDNDEFCKGGLLYAEGLSFFGKHLDDSRKNAILDNLKAGEEVKTPIKNGSLMLLGLAHCFSNDQ